MKVKCFYIIVFLFFGSISVNSAELKLIVDSRNWAPFTYKDKSEIKGMHIDIVKQALKNRGHSFTIESFPRKRAVISVEKGKADAIISVGFSDDFKLIYPEDANKTKESKYSIMQVDHVLVTPKSDYEFEGDIKNIPIPVRMPRGESLAEDFKKLGLKVDIASTEDQNFGKMLRDKNGSVVTTTIIAEDFFRNKAKGRLKIHSVPITSKPYFLAFSKKSYLKKMEMELIWKEIEKLKKDYIFMLKLYSRY